MAVKDIERAQNRSRSRTHSKFQADLAPSDSATVAQLKEELELRSNADLLAEALALFSWAVSERRRGCRIVSESATGEKEVLVSPRLERVAPERLLPHVEINWTQEQLRSFLQLVSASPASPTPALIDVMKRV